MNELTCHWQVTVHEEDGVSTYRTRPMTLHGVLLELEMIYGRTVEENEYRSVYVAEFLVAYAMIKPLPKE